MNKLSKLSLAAIAASALAATSQAVTLTLIPHAPGADPIIVEGANVNSPDDVINDFGIDPGDILYKTDDNSGALDMNFSDDDGLLTLTIEWDGTVPRPTLTYLALKAGGGGASEGGYVLYQISDWSGEDIVVSNTYIVNPRNGNPRDISHIIIFGEDDDGGGGGGNVPDGGTTAMLLGLGVLGMAAASRRK